jgi:exo-beta-1,3-glucanase (GH17 family)
MPMMPQIRTAPLGIKVRSPFHLCLRKYAEKASNLLGAAPLIADINDTRAMLQSMNLSIPVGTAEAGAYFNNMVLEAVDFAVRIIVSRYIFIRFAYFSIILQMANVHSWFANVSIDDAAAWTTEFFNQTDIVQAQALPNNPKMYIGETGWPSVTSLFI